MAVTNTIQIPLGFTAPDFTLYDPITESYKSLNELKSEKGTMIKFICNHCPFVKHIIHELVNIANDYIPKGISFIAINSNDVENYPEDSPEKMKEWAKELNFPFTYLYDKSQSIAKAYNAACTPDFNIFDHNMKCVYRGQLDGSRPENGISVTGIDIRNALDALLCGEDITKNQIPSIGCGIKWKK